MQLQRDVRILGGVLGGAIDVDLIEGDLLRALAGDILVMNGLDRRDISRAVESMSWRVATLLSTYDSSIES